MKYLFLIILFSLIYSFLDDNNEEFLGEEEHSFDYENYLNSNYDTLFEDKSSYRSNKDKHRLFILVMWDFIKCISNPGIAYLIKLVYFRFIIMGAYP